MIRLNKRLNDKKNEKTKMLLQIHDELIFETPQEEVKKISKIIVEEMSSVAMATLDISSTMILLIFFTSS